MSHESQMQKHKCAQLDISHDNSDFQMLERQISAPDIQTAAVI